MNLNLIKLTPEQREACFPTKEPFKVINTLERLFIAVIGAVSLILVYGMLSMAWAGALQDAYDNHEACEGACITENLAKYGESVTVYMIARHSASMQMWTLDDGTYSTQKKCEKAITPGGHCIALSGRMPH